MRNRITQREAIFYQLYKNFREKDDSFIPVFALMGDVWCPELGKWGFVSYECSARASEMIKANPELIERKTLRGKSGATYYGYRLVPNPQKEMIKDQELFKFYERLKRAQKIREENAAMEAVLG